MWTDTSSPAYPAESCYQPVDSATGSGHFPGVFRPKPDGTWWHERFSNTAGIANRSFNFATTCDIPLVGDYPITGDWNWNCHDTIGVFRTSNGVANWLLKNSLSGGAADVNFNFGLISDKPITGDWN